MLVYGDLIAAGLEELASDPTTGLFSGRIYRNTTSGEVRVYSGSVWKTVVDRDTAQTLSAKTIDSSCSISSSASLPVVAPSKGGTGVANNDLATLTRSGNHALTLTTTATTSLTLPTTGTVAVLTDITASNLSGVLGTSKGGTGQNSTATFPTSGTVATIADITAANLGGILASTKGGTGVNNAGTLTYGANNITLTTSGVTGVTLPTTGTLATLAGSETLVNKSIASTSSTAGAIRLPVGNSTTDRPTGTAATLKGMVRYNDTDDVFEGYNEIGGWSSIGGGGTTDRITQSSHGFAVGDVLYLNGATYTKAVASAANTAEVVGVVSKVIDTNQFELTLSGEVNGLSGLTVGEVYFLSASTAGGLTITEPTVVGQISLPVGVAASTTSLYVAPKRGSVVGSSNVRSQIPLANSTTTTVQDISAYDAGELTGWVSIVNTTAANSLRFYVAAQFSKNGAANNYNISYQVSGDTPPTGFSLTTTTAGLLQVTLPSITGFSSASINYALNAPAVGTTFPLSVSARSIVGDTSGTSIPDGYVGQRIFRMESLTGLGTGTITTNITTGITLTSGIWIVQATAEVTIVAPKRMEVWITNSSNAQITDSDGMNLSTVVSDSNNSNFGQRISTGLYNFRVPSGSTQIIKCQSIANLSSTGAAAQFWLQAFRIA